jgi:hypothetical protein
MRRGRDRVGFAFNIAYVQSTARVWEMQGWIRINNLYRSIRWVRFVIFCFPRSGPPKLGFLGSVEISVSYDVEFREVNFLSRVRFGKIARILPPLAPIDPRRRDVSFRDLLLEWFRTTGWGWHIILLGLSIPWTAKLLIVSWGLFRLFCVSYTFS